MFFERYFLAPPKCIFCGNEKCNAAAPLCAECFKKYVSFTLEGCADCGAMPIDCSCFSVKNCTQHYYLFNYGDPLIRRMIFKLKHKCDKYGFAFLAARLVDMIAVKTNNAISFDCVCFVPRDKKGRLRYGFDQAEALAKQAAKLLGIPCVKLLISKGSIGEQKRLKRSFRGIAARLRFDINRKKLDAGRLTYKNVLLVDDIVTTGASMGECARLLKAYGVKRVFGAFIAHTPVRGRIVY